MPIVDIQTNGLDDTALNQVSEHIAARNGCQLVCVAQQHDTSGWAVQNSINGKGEKMLTNHTHFVDTDKTTNSAFALSHKPTVVIRRDKAAGFVNRS